MGIAGQEKILAGTVALIGNVDRVDGDLTCDTAQRYLAAAGVGTLRLFGCGTAEGPSVGAHSRAEPHAWPATASAWAQSLAGCDVVMRSGFAEDADAILDVSARLGIPLVVVRDSDDVVEVVRFAGRRAGNAPFAHEEDSQTGAPQSQSQSQSQSRPQARDGRAPVGPAGAVVAGTLAACEVLLLLAQVAGRPAAGARHVRLPLDGGEPVTQNIPWPPGPTA